MTSASSESTDDLSPSAPHSLASLFGHRGATWREALDGSALVVGGLASAAIAAVLVLVARRRRAS